MSFSKKASGTSGFESSALEDSDSVITPPGSISTRFSVEHGPPPKSIFDNGATPVTAPVTPPIKIPSFSPPPDSKDPDAPKQITVDGNKFGNQIGTVPGSAKPGAPGSGPSKTIDSDTGSTFSSGHATACGAMCSSMISVGAIGLVAMVGVLAVVAYRRRGANNSRNDIERYDPGPHRDSADLARMSGVRTDEEIEKERVRALELLTARKMANYEPPKRSMLNIE